MYGRVMYPAVGWCTVCSGGGVLCGRAVHCVVGVRCTGRQGGVLCGRAMHCVVEWCTVW